MELVWPNTRTTTFTAHASWDTMEKTAKTKVSLLKAPFIWRKVVPGKRVTLPAESTLASVYMRKKLTSLPEPRADLEIMKTCEKITPRCLQIKSVVFLRFTNVGFLYPRNSASYGF